jgi:hypothetical protein
MFNSADIAIEKCVIVDGSLPTLPPAYYVMDFKEKVCEDL